MTSALTNQATSIQSLLNTNGATFLVTSHVRLTLWTLVGCVNSVYPIVCQNFRSNSIVFKVMICIKRFIGSLFFDPIQPFFYLSEPLEVPNPDKMPKVNVKTEVLPGKFFLK